MKRLIDNFWNKLKTQPDIWLFYVFLLTLTLNLRKILLYFPIQGTFNEYTSLYIHLSDLLLLSTISLWYLIILSHTRIKMSRNKLGITHFIHKLSLFLPFLLVIWSFISIIWSTNKIIALFRSLKLLEFYGLYLFLILRFVPLLFKTFHKNSNKNNTKPLVIVPRGTIISKKVFFSKPFGQVFILIIILTSFSQSIIAVIQFITQKSIGLFFLKESLISPSLPGVAKIIINNQRFIRGYGLMPHPNILGGFLLFSIIITLLYLKLFHVEQLANKKNTISLLKKENKKEIHFKTNDNFINHQKNVIVPRRTISNFKKYLFGFPNSSINYLKKYISEHLWLIKGILLIQSLALLSSFSKSAILGLIISLAFIYYTTIQKSKKMFHVEHFRIILLSLFISLISFLFFFQFNFHVDFIKSLQERLFYLNVSRGTILVHPLIGVGAGQFVLNLVFFFQKQPLIWQYQPVHNVFLLIWSNLGFIGLLLFFSWLLKLFHVEQLQSRIVLKRTQEKENSFNIISNDQKNKIVPRGTILNNKHFLKKFLQLIFLKNNFFYNQLSKPFNKNLSSNKRIVGDNLSVLYNNTYYLSIRYLQGILLGFLFIMLFDHYFWDIQQGSLLFWLVAGLIVGLQKIDS